MLTLGCHLSTSDGYAAMGRTAQRIGANTFAFFTRNPRGARARRLDTDDIGALRRMLEDDGFGRLVAHAPYIYNAASATARIRDNTVASLADDLERLELLPGNFCNLHPGSHVSQGIERGIELVACALASAMPHGPHTTVLLETMAGKGSEIGGRFEELAAIIEAVRRRDPVLGDRLGVCLDTCHVSDAGYDIISDLDGVLEEFDHVVGLARLGAVHVNDSKNPRGSHKDRHARLGEGYLGSPALGGSEAVFRRIVTHPVLASLPLILETPNELDGYACEIRMLRAAAGRSEVSERPLVDGPSVAERERHE